MVDEVQTIVIDNGSGMIKAGFAGDDAPRSVFPSIVGRPKYYISSVAGNNKDIYIGDEVYAKMGVLIQNYPIERGIVTNWDDMEKIWHHTFYNELKIDPAEYPVFITEASRNPDFNREKMMQLMFETFNVPSFYVCPQAPLSLFASGRTTGIACEIGDDLIQVVPLFENYIFNKAIMRLNYGGRDLTAWLCKICNERGYTFITSADKEIARDIKEEHTYVALDYEAELNKARTSSECNYSYDLPDGNVIKISDERFRCPELLFKPLMNGFEYDGIDKTIYDSIMLCNIGARKDLFSNIIISGGSSMFEGLPERIEKEIKNIASPLMKIKVIAAPERKYQVWVGGSIFASLATFPQKVITKDKYNETGPRIVHFNCI